MSSKGGSCVSSTWGCFGDEFGGVPSARSESPHQDAADIMVTAGCVTATAAEGSLEVFGTRLEARCYAKDPRHTFPTPPHPTAHTD